MKRTIISLLILLSLAILSFIEGLISNNQFNNRLLRTIAKENAINIPRYPVASKRQLLTSDQIGTLQGVEGFAEAFIGGTVGVMSVAFIVELRKLNDKNSESCPYCMGNGEILCGACVGTKVSSDGKTPCNACGGRGLVLCINCKGDGRITPLVLQSKGVRDPEYAKDGIEVDSP